MHCHRCRVWALPPETEMKSTLGFTEFGRSHHRDWALPPSLSAPTIEFGRSHHRVWALSPSLCAPARRRRNPLLDGDDLYLYTYICELGFQYYPTRRVLCSTSDSDTRARFADMGSGFVEAGCCDTSQHR